MSEGTRKSQSKEKKSVGTIGSKDKTPSVGTTGSKDKLPSVGTIGSKSNKSGGLKPGAKPAIGNRKESQVSAISAISHGTIASKVSNKTGVSKNTAGSVNNRI